MAAVRTPQKATRFEERGFSKVILDLNDETTHLPALEGIHTLFVLTGYTVDMLKHSKALLDNAKNCTADKPTGWGITRHLSMSLRRR